MLELLKRAQAKGLVDYYRLLFDGSFFPERMGRTKVAHGYKGKGSTFNLIADRNGRPLELTATTANEKERKQVPRLLDQIRSKNFYILKADKVRGSKSSFRNLKKRPLSDLSL